MIYFNLDNEANIPTLYAGLMILFSSILLMILSSVSKLKKDKFYFNCLSFVFIYLSLDELISFHEKLRMPFINNFIKENWDIQSNFLIPIWVIPYAFITLFVVIFFLKLIVNLPKNIRNLIYFSGFIYIAGELFLEIVSISVVKNFVQHSLKEFLYNVFISIEETLAMLGIVLFNFSLLKLLQMKVKYLKVKIIN